MSKMKELNRRILAYLLTTVMVLTMLPVSATFADGTDDPSAANQIFANDTVVPTGNGSYGVAFTPANMADYNTLAPNVNITVKEQIPTVRIDYISEMFTGFAPGVYTISGLTILTFTGSSYRIDPELMQDRNVVIVKKGDGVATTDSDEQVLLVPSCPVMPMNILGINETAPGRNDGMITGVSPAMEYRSSAPGAPWISCTGTTVTGLASSTYEVRIKAVENTSFASNTAKVKITTGVAALTVSPPTFSTVESGYSRPAAKSITIRNTGDGTANISGVTASGTNFEIGGSGSNVDVGQSISTWTIIPQTGLAAGTYTATITVTYNGGKTATTNLTFIVTESGQTSQPVLCNVTFNANGGKIGSQKTKTITVQEGKPLGSLPKVAKRSKYVFKGWYTKTSGGKKVTTSTKVTKSMELWAHWAKAKKYGRVIKTKTLYVRSLPSLHVDINPVVGALKKGQTFRITGFVDRKGTNDDWYKLKYESKDCYAFAKYVKVFYK